MPKTLFDYSEMKSNINDFLKQLDDLSFTEEEWERYGELCYDLSLIRGLTEHYYTPQPDGTFPALNEQDRMELVDAYNKAIQAVCPILQSEETGPVAMALRNIADQLAPALMRDRRSLEVMDLSQKDMSLPELIARGRSQAVDLGKGYVTTVGAASSTRYYLELEDGEGVQKGFFTPHTIIAPKAKYDQLLASMEKRYPSMGKLIGALKKIPVENFGKCDLFEFDYKAQATKDKSIEQWKQGYDRILKGDLYQDLGLENDVIDQAMQEQDFYRFSQEFLDSFHPIWVEYNRYMEGNYVDVPEGGNVDRRNLAFYRMAGLLGKQHIVPETKLLTVTRNGQEIPGTFMAEAQGVDVNTAGPNHPVLQAKPEAFENPSVASDIASMQVLDYICGNVDRHPGNFILRFDPQDGEKMKLVGISLIDNDMSFGREDGTAEHKGARSTVPNTMGVVGEDLYNAMRLMTREQMELMLADCRFSKEELDAAWIRKEKMQKAIEADMEYFRDKEPGYTEKGRIRLVPEGDWDKYTIQSLGVVHDESQFSVISKYPEVVKHNNIRVEEERKTEEKFDQLKATLGLSLAPKKPEDRVPTRTKAIGTGLEREPNPLGLGEDTLNLALPSLGTVRTVGSNLSKRYVLTYKEQGEDKTVFFTPPQISSAHTGYNFIFEQAIDAYPQYQEELAAFRDYYRSDDYQAIDVPGKLSRVDGTKLGFSQEKFDALKNDPGFQKAYKELTGNISRDIVRYFMLSGHGQVLGEGRRMELRNVAMSDVGDLLGTPDLLCRSRTVRVMCDGKLTDGVVMDLAKGEDPGSFKADDNHPVRMITTEQAKDCYNQPGPLKQIADMQILDYVCLNVDRHQENLFYEYEGLGTDHPKLVGIQGIDNDGSFGKLVPNPNQKTNMLPALNNMVVISREMWDKIQDPQLPDKVADAILKRGMTQEEAKAAKERIQMVKDAVNGGKLRIVEQDQWGKGENSFEKLAGEDQSNLFRTIRYQIVDPASKNADAKAAAGIKPVVPVKKPLKGTMCVKVDQISEKVLEDAELGKLQSEAELSWQNEMKEQLKAAPEVATENYADYVKELKTLATTLKQAVDAGNPFFSFTSKTYKNMIRACNELVSQTEKALRHMEKDGEAFQPKDAALLGQKLNKLRDASAAYTQKKNHEIARGVRIKPIGRSRMDISGKVSDMTMQMESRFREMSTKERTKLSPFEEAQTRLREEQGKLASLKGNSLKEKVAEILYLKSLTKVDLKTRKDPKFAQSLLAGHIRSQKQKIMESNQFQELCKQPEDRLRAMAAGKGAKELMNTFLQSLARSKQMEKQKQVVGPSKDKPEGRNLNMY